LFDVGRRKVELDGDHTLASGVLQVLQHALVSRVVRDDEAELRSRLEGHTEAIDRHLATMVSQRMQHDGRVLAGLDDLVEVADGALPDSTRQRPVDPLGVSALDEESSDEVSGGQVVMAGNRDERPLQVKGHRFDEAGLPATRRSLQEDGQSLAERGLKY